MDQTQPATPARSSARRRLLRGSFSLPAVLAVHNGSALAARSNQFRCMINATTLTGAQVFPQPAPNGLRKKNGWVKVYSATTMTETKYYILVSDLLTVGTYVGGFVAPASGSGTTWVEFSATAPYQYVTPIGSTTGTSTRAAVLLQNYSGVIKVVGYVKPGQSSAGTNQSGANASCWSSVKP